MKLSSPEIIVPWFALGAGRMFAASGRSRHSFGTPQAWEGRPAPPVGPPTTLIPTCGDPNRRKAPGGSTGLTLTSPSTIEPVTDL